MPESTPPAPTKAPEKQFITLSMSDFEALQTRRFQYRILYGIVYLGWFWWVLFSNNLTGLTYNVLVSVMIICLVAASYRLYKVMTTLGYAWWIPVGLGIIQVIPIPGILILFQADKQVAKAIDSAAPASHPK